MSKASASVKVTIVITPLVAVTVTVPAARLLLTSAPGGTVVTLTSVISGGKVSVITTGTAGTTRAALQLPAGAGPAGTVTGVPATLNAKGVPMATPVPATLQICTKAV